LSPTFPRSIESLWSLDTVYIAVKIVLEQHNYNFDALVYGCDTIAVGAMRAVKESGA
jgi:DNA-binding LacI/PurR family transcriptional regulator